MPQGVLVERVLDRYRPWPRILIALVLALLIGTVAVIFAQARDLEGCYAHWPAEVAASRIDNPWERTVEIPVSLYPTMETHNGRTRNRKPYWQRQS